MDVRIFLGSVAFSTDAEHTDWHVSEMFEKLMGDRLEWFRCNYPDMPIKRRMVDDPATYQIIYQWYVDFHDTDGLVHYKLTYG